MDKARIQRMPWWVWKVACTLRQRHFWLPLPGLGWMGYCRCSRPLPAADSEENNDD